MPATRDWLKRRARLYWILRRGRAAVGELLPPVPIPGVPGRIHRNDTMIPKAVPEHAGGYVWSGHQGAAFVADAVALTARDAPPAAGLDLGCGYGRVLRHLVSLFPETQWTACDVEPGAVRFCAREFGAIPVRSRAELTQVDFPSAPYDIVWMGSLLTHLDADANEAVARKLATVTHAGAVVACSTHGPELASDLGTYGPGMEGDRDLVEASLATHGFGYAPYPHYRDASYGIAFHNPDYVDRLFHDAFEGKVARIELRKRAWMESHDLHAFRVTGAG